MTLPPTGPPPGQPWAPQWPPNTAPSKRGPAWMLPVAIVVAAVLITGGAITVALISKSGSPALPGGSSASATAAPPSPASNGADSSTCVAWRSAKAALDTAVDPMPADWNWNTPGIDGLIAQSNAIITNAMDLFEPHIAAQPADVATAARAYVKARRSEVAKLANHTYTEADDVPSTTAYATLNQLCHMADQP
jgi:hypothetical protein